MGIFEGDTLISTLSDTLSQSSPTKSALAPIALCGLLEKQTQCTWTQGHYDTEREQICGEHLEQNLYIGFYKTNWGNLIEWKWLLRWIIDTASTDTNIAEDECHHENHQNQKGHQIAVADPQTFPAENKRNHQWLQWIQWLESKELMVRYDSVPIEHHHRSLLILDNRTKADRLSYWYSEWFGSFL